jgi:hypothetical protein
LKIHAPSGAGRWPYCVIDVKVDSGADCCLFAQSVADRLGILRPADAPVETVISTIGGEVEAWFAQVTLEIFDPLERNVKERPRRAHRWEAVVGFFPDPPPTDDNPAPEHFGVLGVNGGLGLFRQTVLDFGSEPPCIRLHA